VHIDDMHVLLVDDDPLTRRMLSRLLVRDFGVTTGEAANGLQALELLARERFDLALIDLEMPTLDGGSLLVAIRESEALRTLPVIVLSSVRDAARVRRVVAAGVSDYLAKPIRLDTTGVRLARFFEERGHAVPRARADAGAASASASPRTEAGDAGGSDIRARERDIAAGVEQAFGMLAGMELTTGRDATGVAEPALTSEVRIDADTASMTIELRLSPEAASQLAHLAGGETVDAAKVVLWDLAGIVAGRVERLLSAPGRTATAGTVTIHTAGGPGGPTPALRLPFTTGDGATAVECLVIC
jgi:CheY-like chemotaxis protein